MTKKAAGVKSVLVVMLVIFAGIELYEVTKLVTSPLTCLFNPWACVTQVGTDALVGMISLFVNPITIFIVTTIWAVMRLMK